MATPLIEDVARILATQHKAATRNAYGSCTVAGFVVDPARRVPPASATAHRTRTSSAPTGSRTTNSPRSASVRPTCMPSP